MRNSTKQTKMRALIFTAFLLLVSLNTSSSAKLKGKGIMKAYLELRQSGSDKIPIAFILCAKDWFQSIGGPCITSEEASEEFGRSFIQNPNITRRARLFKRVTSRTCLPPAECRNATCECPTNQTCLANVQNLDNDCVNEFGAACPKIFKEDVEIFCGKTGDPEKTDGGGGGNSGTQFGPQFQTMIWTWTATALAFVFVY